MPARSWQVIIGAITGEGGILFYISKAIADAAMGGDGGDLTFTSPTKFMATGSCWQAVLLVLYYLMMFRCLAAFFPPYAGPNPSSSSLHEVHSGHLVQQPPCLRPPLPHLISPHHLSSLRLIPGVSHLSCQAPMSRSSHSCKEPLLVLDPACLICGLIPGWLRSAFDEVSVRVAALACPYILLDTLTCLGN